MDRPATARDAVRLVDPAPLERLALAAFSLPELQRYGAAIRVRVPRQGRYRPGRRPGTVAHLVAEAAPALAGVLSVIRPIPLGALRKQLKESRWWRGDHSRVVFRDAAGGVVICEREDD